jgi:hypothetical protein
MKHLTSISVAPASTNPNPVSSILGYASYIWGIIFFVKNWV